MAIRRQEVLVGTAAEWAATTKPLPRGQVAIQAGDPSIVKVGDGINAWPALEVEGSVTAYTAAGAASGFDRLLDLDYDTNDPQLPEPWMVRVRNAAGTLVKSWWLNESGLLRIWAIRKDEPGLKVHAFSNASTGPVLEVRGSWSDGAPRRWGVDGQGRPLLGANQIVGANVIVLATGAPVPAGLPAGTVIVRTA